MEILTPKECTSGSDKKVGGYVLKVILMMSVLIIEQNEK